MPIFRKIFFFGEKKNRFEFLICYYSRLKDTEKKILNKYNLLLLLWFFEVGASKKKRVSGPGDFDSSGHLKSKFFNDS